MLGGRSQATTSSSTTTTMIDDDRNIGRVVAGRYRLDRLLGKGGFGSVFQGWDTQIGRDVAVKLLDVMAQSRTSDQQAELAERFRREAMAAGRINHPAIVTIFDFGIGTDKRDDAYLVMELLEGHDLEHELQNRGPMMPARALALFVPLLEGLGRGHSMGIVHKDIKPSNIFIRRPGTASESMCVVDFGVARVVHEDRLTLTGMIVGTPQYMAPEYITDTTVSPRLDVYQMGLILAELITGVPAVPSGESFVKSCNRHFTGDLQVPDDLYLGDFGEALGKALAPNPNDRFASATEFAEALAAVDPNAVTIDSHATTVFQRRESPPTLDEPPLFPPMRPDEVTASLARGDDEPPQAPTAPMAPAPTRPAGEGLGPLPAVVVPADAREEPALGENFAVGQSSSQHRNPLADFGAPSSEAEGEWSWANEGSQPAAPMLEPPAPVAKPGSGLPVPAILALGGVLILAVAGVITMFLTLSEPIEDAAPAPPTTDPAQPAIAMKKIDEPELRPQMHLKTEPSGAEVRIGDEVLGETPLDVGEDYLGQEVTLSLDGYETRTFSAVPGTQLLTLEKIVEERALTAKSDRKAKKPPSEKAPRPARTKTEPEEAAPKKTEPSSKLSEEKKSQLLDTISAGTREESEPEPPTDGSAEPEEPAAEAGPPAPSEDDSPPPPPAPTRWNK